jgi:hypothetical protein
VRNRGADHNIDAERRACKVRLRAERKAGQLDKRREKQQGALLRGSTLEPRGNDAPTLRDLGVSKRQAHDWRKLADVPQDVFDAALADPTRKPTTSGIIATARRSGPSVYNPRRLLDEDRMPLTAAERSKRYRARCGKAHIALALDGDDLATFLVDTGVLTEAEAGDRHNLERGLEKWMAGEIFRHAVARAKRG